MASSVDSPRFPMVDPAKSSSNPPSKERPRAKSPTFLLEKSIRANPNDPFAWHLLGVHCMTKGSIDEGFRCFTRAEQIKVGFSTSNQYYLALCHKEKGNKEESMRLLTSSIALPARNAVDKKGQKLARLLFEQLKKEEKDPK
ncbi:hypothetical protein PENTCL1PPCAC_26328 [Pristionchus entomophagus]|uniref:Tetratricopeptide repeat-containing protein n=1 Tax=Pristionchus entomophagus TaxID=358040 RepID=A0AAV5UCS4_9BILA|nr:hypothetical protein PENTCL1PPCAC_26328 [Pristionchus entomophagus]